MAIVLKSNEFWGKRAGAIHPIDGPIIKIRRGSNNGGTSNNGPSNRRQRRFYWPMSKNVKKGSAGILIRKSRKADSSVSVFRKPARAD